MSAGVLAQPSETRIAAPASSALAPMAASTWEGCTLPDEQAEPELTATPARSSAIIWGSAGRHANAPQTASGSRRAAHPTTYPPQANLLSTCTHLYPTAKKRRATT